MIVKYIKRFDIAALERKQAVANKIIGEIVRVRLDGAGVKAVLVSSGMPVFLDPAIVNSVQVLSVFGVDNIEFFGSTDGKHILLFDIEGRDTWVDRWSRLVVAVDKIDSDFFSLSPCVFDGIISSFDLAIANKLPGIIVRVPGDKTVYHVKNKDKF